jgi:hypothetical protein
LKTNKTYLTLAIALLIFISSVSAVTLEAGLKFYPSNAGNLTALNSFDVSYLQVTDNNVTLNLTSSYMSLLDTGMTTNLTVNLKGYSYNDVFNGTSSTPQCHNLNSCTVKNSPNNRTIVFQYLTDTQPKISSMDTTVQTISYNLAGTTPQDAVLTITYTGTGTVTISNMGTGQKYDIFYNGAIYENAQTDSYIMTQPGTYRFLAHSDGFITMPQNSPERFPFFVLLVMIIFGAIYMLIQNPSVGMLVLIIGASIAALIVRSMIGG